MSRISQPSQITPTDTPVVLRHEDGIVTLDGRGALFAATTTKPYFSEIAYVAKSPSIHLCGQGDTPREAVESLAAIISCHLHYVLKNPQRAFEMLQRGEGGWEQHVPRGSAKGQFASDAIAEFVWETAGQDLAQTYLPSVDSHSITSAMVNGILMPTAGSSDSTIQYFRNILIQMSDPAYAELQRLKNKKRWN